MSEYGYSQEQTQEPMVWERVEWRQGDGRYVFEVAHGGLHATLSSPHATKLTLPMVAWEGLLDALAAARRTKVRAERNLPSRMGARWSEIEARELARTFKAGGSIAQLARVHNRTQFAVEAQLDRQGLWDRVERRPTARAIGGHPLPGEAANAGRPAQSAPVAGRRDDAGPQSPFVAKDALLHPASAPAESRRPEAGQQAPSRAADTDRSPASASGGSAQHEASPRPPHGSSR